MSWDDYVFEDPMESYDRCQEEGDYYVGNNRRELIERICKKCDHEFASTYPCACPECGGWTEEIYE
jgi:hypothetical protein